MLVGIGWLLHQQALQQTRTAAIDAERRALAAARDRRDPAPQAQDAEAQRLIEQAQRQRQAREAEQQRQEQARIERERQHAANQAAQTIRDYYARLDRGDVGAAVGTWYTVGDRDALTKAIGRITDADVRYIGHVELAADLSWARVPVRVSVRNRGESATIWAGPIHLKRWQDHWEIGTMRHLEKQ